MSRASHSGRPKVSPDPATALGHLFPELGEGSAGLAPAPVRGNDHLAETPRRAPMRDVSRRLCLWKADIPRVLRDLSSGPPLDGRVPVACVRQRLRPAGQVPARLTRTVAGPAVRAGSESLAGQAPANSPNTSACHRCGLSPRCSLAPPAGAGRRRLRQVPSGWFRCLRSPAARPEVRPDREAMAEPGAGQDQIAASRKLRSSPDGPARRMAGGKYLHSHQAARTSTGARVGPRSFAPALPVRSVPGFRIVRRPRPRLGFISFRRSSAPGPGPMGIRKPSICFSSGAFACAKALVERHEAARSGPGAVRSGIAPPS